MVLPGQVEGGLSPPRLLAPEPSDEPLRTVELLLAHLDVGLQLLFAAAGVCQLRVQAGQLGLHLNS